MTSKHQKSALERVASFATQGKASLPGSPWHEVSAERLKLRSSRASTSSEDYLSRPETSMSLMEDDVRSKNSTLRRSQRPFTASSEAQIQDNDLARVSQYIEYLDQYSRELEERFSYDKKMKIETTAVADRSDLPHSRHSDEKFAENESVGEVTNNDSMTGDETDVSSFLNEFKRASKAPEQALKIQRWWKMMRMMHKYRRFRKACRTIRNRYYGSILRNWCMTAYVSKHVRLSQLQSNFSSWSALVRDSIIWNEESAMIFLACSRAGGGFHRELFLRLNDKSTYRRAGMDYNWGKGWKFGRPLPTREHVVVAQLLRRIFLWSTRWRMRRWSKYVLGCRSQKNQAIKKLEVLGDERRHYRFWLKFHMWRRWSVVKICERMLKDIPEFHETIYEWNEWYKMYCTKKRLHTEQIKSLGRRFLTRLSWQRFQRFQQVIKGKAYLLEQTIVFRSRNVRRAFISGWTEYAKFQRAKKHRTQLILRRLSKLCQYSSFQNRKRKMFEQKWRRFRLQKTLIALAQVSSAMLVLKVGLLNRIRQSTPRVLWVLFAWMAFERKDAERKPGGITSFGVCDAHFALSDSLRLWSAYATRRINLKRCVPSLPMDPTGDILRSMFASWKSLKSTTVKKDIAGDRIKTPLQIDMYVMGPMLAKMMLNKRMEMRTMSEKREKVSNLSVQERIAQNIRRIEEELGLNQSHISAEIPKLRLFMSQEASNQELIHSLRVRCLKRDYKLLLAGEIRDCLKSFDGEWSHLGSSTQEPVNAEIRKKELSAAFYAQEQILFPEFSHSLKQLTDLKQDLNIPGARKQSTQTLDERAAREAQQEAQQEAPQEAPQEAAGEEVGFVADGASDKVREALDTRRLDPAGIREDEEDSGSEDVETSSVSRAQEDSPDNISGDAADEAQLEIMASGIQSEQYQEDNRNVLSNHEGLKNLEAEAKIKEKIISSAISNFPLERVSPVDMPHDEYLKQDYESRRSDLEQRFREMQTQFPSYALHSRSHEDDNERARKEQADSSLAKDKDSENNAREKSQGEYVFFKRPKPFHGIDVSMDFSEKPSQGAAELSESAIHEDVQKDGPQRRRNVSRDYNAKLDKMLQDHLEHSQRAAVEQARGNHMQRARDVLPQRIPVLAKMTPSVLIEEHQDRKVQTGAGNITAAKSHQPAVSSPQPQHGGLEASASARDEAGLDHGELQPIVDVCDPLRSKAEATFREIIEENEWILEEAADINEALKGTMDSLYWRSKVISGRSQRQRGQQMEISRRDEMSKIAQQQKTKQLQEFLSFQDLNAQLQEEYQVNKSMSFQEFQKLDLRQHALVKLKSLQAKQFKKQIQIPEVEREFLHLASPVQSLWLNVNPFPIPYPQDMAEKDREYGRKLTPLTAARDSFKQGSSMPSDSFRQDSSMPSDTARPLSSLTLKKIKRVPRPRAPLDLLPACKGNLLKSETIEDCMQTSIRHSKSEDLYQPGDFPIQDACIRGATLQTMPSEQRQAIDDLILSVTKYSEDNFQKMQKPLVNRIIGQRPATSLDCHSPIKIRGDGLLSREGKLWKQRSFNALRTDKDQEEEDKRSADPAREEPTFRASSAQLVVGGKKLDNGSAGSSQKAAALSVQVPKRESERSFPSGSTEVVDETMETATESLDSALSSEVREAVALYTIDSVSTDSFRKYVTSDIPWTPWTSMSASQILLELTNNECTTTDRHIAPPQDTETKAEASDPHSELASSTAVATSDDSIPEPLRAMGPRRRERKPSDAGQTRIKEPTNRSHPEGRTHSVQEIQLTLGEGNKRIPLRQQSEKQKHMASRQERKWDLFPRMSLEEQSKKKKRKKESIKSMYLAGIATMKPTYSPQVVKASIKQPLNEQPHPSAQPLRQQVKGPYLSAHRIDGGRVNKTSGTRLPLKIERASSTMAFSATESQSVNELRVVDSPTDAPELEEHSSQSRMQTELGKEPGDEVRSLRSDEASYDSESIPAADRCDAQQSSQSSQRVDTRMEGEAPLSIEDREMIEQMKEFPDRSYSADWIRIDTNYLADGNVAETSDSYLSDASSPHSIKLVGDVHIGRSDPDVARESRRDESQDKGTEQSSEETRVSDRRPSEAEGSGEKSEEEVDQSEAEPSAAPISHDEKEAYSDKLSKEFSQRQEDAAVSARGLEEPSTDKLQAAEGDKEDHSTQSSAVKAHGEQEMEQGEIQSGQDEEQRKSENRPDGRKETKRMRPVEVDLLQGYREKRLTLRMMEKQSVSPWKQSHLKQLERGRNLTFDSDSGEEEEDDWEGGEEGEEEGEADRKASGRVKGYRPEGSSNAQSVVKIPLKILEETNRKFVAKRMEYHRYADAQEEQPELTSLFSSGTYDYYLRRLQQKKRDFVAKD
eukprot:751089-Hanusia_phi.AAC.6